MNNKLKLLNALVFWLPFIVILASWIFVGTKCFLLIMGIFSLLLYFHIIVTALSNALLRNEVNRATDFIWKILLILIASLSFGIYFNF